VVVQVKRQTLDNTRKTRSFLFRFDVASCRPPRRSGRPLFANRARQASSQTMALPMTQPSRIIIGTPIQIIRRRRRPLTQQLRRAL